MYPLGTALGFSTPSQNPEEFATVPIGSTVMPGTNVINDNNIHKLPLLYHPEYLLEYIENMKFTEIFTSLLTGTVPTPIKDVTNGSISSSGTAAGYAGPGILTAQGNKLVVTPPNSFIWANVTAYTVAVRTNNGVELLHDNKTYETVSLQDMNNNTIPHSYMTVDDFKTWYNGSKTGDSVTLDYTLANFSDGRNMITPDQITTYFGSSVSNYIKTHDPTGQPVLAYNNSTNEKVIGSSQTVMDAYADMDNNARVSNALAFVQSWNNTIIPPHSWGYQSNNVSYTQVYDPDPTQGVGWADHGTCPPGRALRDAALNAGFSIPTGMTMDYTNVISDTASLTSGIQIYNNRDYPIKIIMWTDGASTGMPIYAQIVELSP